MSYLRKCHPERGEGSQTNDKQRYFALLSMTT